MPRLGRARPHRPILRGAVLPAPASSITLTSPSQYQVFQRSGKTGAIYIAGTYTGSPTAIEASFAGGTYKTVVSSPSAGTFTAALSGQAQGQGTLTVRFTNDTATNASVTFVGIGELFAVAGQSNAEGQGTNLQTYSSTDGFKAGMAVQSTGVWAELTDPTHTAGVGSPWPLLATQIMNAQHVPFGLLPTAVGGTSITEWQAGLGKLLTLQSRITTNYGCRAVLWYQGETDSVNGMSTDTYAGYFDAMVANTASTTGYAGQLWLPAKMPDYGPSAGTPTQQAAIRAAFEREWYSNRLTRPGPDLQTVANDGLHIRTDAALLDEATRWYTAITAAFYVTGGGGTVAGYSRGRLVNAGG